MYILLIELHIGSGRKQLKCVLGIMNKMTVQNQHISLFAKSVD